MKTKKYVRRTERETSRREERWTQDKWKLRTPDNGKKNRCEEKIILKA